MTRLKTLLVASLVGMLTTFGWLATSAPAVTYRIVAKTGDAAPGTPQPRAFNTFGVPTINNSGQVAFFTLFTNTPGNALFSEGGGTLHPVARSGMAAPGTGATFTGFTSNDPPVINEAGQTAFRGSLTGSGVTSANNYGIWTDAGGTLRLVARKGDSAPGGPASAVYSAVNLASLSDGGHVAFSGEITGPGIPLFTEGVWLNSIGGTDNVALARTPIPNAVGDEVFGSFSSPLVNSAGKVAFRAAIRGTNVDGLNDYSIWTGNSANLQLVARDGTPAPGTAAGVNFYSLDPPTFNQAGEAAFFATLTGGGSTANNDSGIWSNAGGGLHLLAREGTPPTDGLNSQTYLSGPKINQSGHTAFRVSPANTSLTGSIFHEQGGVLTRIARENDPAAGSPGDVFGILDPPNLNSAGQIAFYAALNDRLIAGDEAGFWIYGANGLEMIVRTQQAIEVAPGDFRTIERLDYTASDGNENGQASAFNDHGQLAFRAHFTDGTWAVIVANASSVPEPATAWIVAIAGVLILGCRTTRQPRCVR